MRTTAVRPIPFMDLWSLHEPIEDEIREATDRVIKNSSFTLGEELERFEHAFALYTESPFAVGVSSGTDALHLALLACGVKPGDEVITVPNTFIATTEAITMCGATPVLADIDEATYCMDPSRLAGAITEKTTAVIPVHLYGQIADMDAIMAIARSNGLKVIEDACQAHGAKYRGRQAGSFGDAACFSFYPGKNLGGFGDGGMVVTTDKDVAERIRVYRHHGQVGKNLHDVEGFCDRLDAIQAAVLNVKLAHLDTWNDARRAAAEHYDDVLEDCGVTRPFTRPGLEHVYHLYVVRTPYRDRLQQALTEQNIGTGIHYPVPLHLSAAYKRLGYNVGDFPVSEKAASEILSLPMFPGITEEQIEEIGHNVRRFT